MNLDSTYRCVVEKVLPSGDATLRIAGKLGAIAYGWFKANGDTPALCPGIARDFRPLGFMTERAGSLRREDNEGRVCIRMAWCEDNEPPSSAEWDRVLDPYARTTAEGQPLGSCGLNCICDVEEEAYHELIKLDANPAPQYPWNAERMENNLKYVWIRSVETGRAYFFADGGKAGYYQRGPALSPDPVLQEHNITSEFVLFNTGLSDKRGDPIFAMLTRICEGTACIEQRQYALWAEGIMTASHPVVRRLFSRGIRPTSGLDLSMARVTYPTPSRLDLSLGISFIDEARHIVEDNLQRIVDAGLLCPGDDVREKLDEWTRDAVSRAQRDPLFVVPQFYYKICRMRDGTQYYDGRYQFMLPLRCGRSEPVLALAIVPRPDTNLAVTVLTRDMAMSHARVLDMIDRFLGKRKTMRAQVKTKLVEEEGKTYVDIAAGV